ncbi:MAG: ABC transporter ATP-binding protein [Actinobacteria bacterium]|nr:MAG: ABC transporter ATP-binding protein [Actinomycetota bacterium]
MSRHRGADASLTRSLWRFRSYGRPYLRALLGGISLRIGELVFDLAKPWPLAVVVDGVLGRRRLRGLLASLAGPFAHPRLTLLTAAAVASFVLAGLSGLCDYLGDRLMNGAGERITADVRRDLFAHLQRLPLAFHDRRAVGELTSRVSVDTSRIEDSLVDVFSMLIPSLLQVVGLGAVIFVLDWRLGLLGLGVAPLVLLVATRLSVLNRSAAGRRRTAEGALSALSTESLLGIRTIHAHGRHDLHDERFAATNRETLGAGLRVVDLTARFTPIMEMVTAVGTAGLLWLGGYGVLRGWWTLGLLLVAMSYLRSMLSPMRSLSKLSQNMARGAVSADRVAEVLATPVRDARPGERSLGPLPARARGDIRLSAVTMDYGRGPVLHGIDLDVVAGERVALVGANGSGKSSLLSLVAGLYDPTAGGVSIDGRALSSLPTWWLRSQIGVVLQDTFLFAGTLWDNIAYGRPGALPREVVAAAETALVAEFAETLPSGYSTVLGDRGIGLSGAQCQRVGIARALLLDAPIVLLDEPISGLDLPAEEVVVLAIGNLLAGRTVIMATHRPALLGLAGRVIHMDRGRFTPESDVVAPAPVGAVAAIDLRRSLLRPLNARLTRRSR